MSNQEPLNAVEAAEYVGLSYSRFLTLGYEGRGPSIAVPSSGPPNPHQYSRSDLDEWKQQRDDYYKPAGLLSSQEAAEYTGVTYVTFMVMLCQGKGPKIRRRGKARVGHAFALEDLDAWGKRPPVRPGRPLGAGLPEDPEELRQLQTFSVRQAAEYLQVAPTTLDQYRCRGKGPCFSKRNNGRVYYEREDLDRWRKDRQRGVKL